MHKLLPYLALICGLTSCANSKLSLVPRQSATFITLRETYKADVIAEAEPFKAVYNAQVSRHNEIAKRANALLTKLDGRKQQSAWAFIGSKGALGAVGVASAALTAATVTANAPWIQALTATGSGVNMVTTEMNAQELTAAAYKDALRYIATDIIAAKNGLVFDEALASILLISPGRPTDVESKLSENDKALTNLENAVTLSPLTYKMVADKPGSADDKERLATATLEQKAIEETKKKAKDKDEG